MLVFMRDFAVRGGCEFGMRVVMTCPSCIVGVPIVFGQVRLAVLMFVVMGVQVRVLVRMTVNELAMAVGVLVAMLVHVLMLVTMGVRGSIDSRHRILPIDARLWTGVRGLVRGQLRSRRQRTADAKLPTRRSSA